MGQHLSKLLSADLDLPHVEKEDRDHYAAYRGNLARWGQAWFDQRRGLTPTAQRLVDIRLASGWVQVKK